MSQPSDLDGVRAVALTACPLLASRLVELHPAVRTALLTRLAGIGTLRDCDALLLLTRHDDTLTPTGRPGGPAGNGLRTTTWYVGTDLDDAGVWERARSLGAAEVLFLPDDDAKLTLLLQQHLQASR